MGAQRQRSQQVQNDNLRLVTSPKYPHSKQPSAQELDFVDQQVRMRQQMPSSAHASAGAKIINSKGDQQSNPQGEQDQRGAFRSDKNNSLSGVMAGDSIKLGGQ